MRFAGIAILAALVAPAARADGTPASLGSEPAIRQTAPKDCTRLNGRIGYYGNPWCSPAEQRAWDLWEARRRARTVGN
jgi:hypothetical protein